MLLLVIVVRVLVVEIVVIVALIERWGSRALSAAATVAPAVVGRSRSRCVTELLVPTQRAAATCAIALLLRWWM